MDIDAHLGGVRTAKFASDAPVDAGAELGAKRAYLLLLGDQEPNHVVDDHLTVLIQIVGGHNFQIVVAEVRQGFIIVRYG